MRLNSRLTGGAVASVMALAVLLGGGTAWSVPAAEAASPNIGGGTQSGYAPPSPLPTTPPPPSATTATTAPHAAGPGPDNQAPASTTTTSPNGNSGGAQPDSPQVAAMKAEAASVRRTPPNSTAALQIALGPLSQFGLTPEQQALVGFGRFPVAGSASFTDDWLEYRPGPPPALHPGIDIAAAQSTPIRSPANGVLDYNYSDPHGYGLVALVTQTDRTVFLMAHMSATVLGLSSGAPVRAGQVIGFVGATGDATGPHVHFEVHPHGGPGIDGKPFLDQALADAVAAAPALIAEYTGQTSSDVVPVVTAPEPAPLPEPVPADPAVLTRHTPGVATDWVGATSRAVAAIGCAASVMLVVDRIRRRRTRTAV